MTFLMLDFDGVLHRYGCKEADLFRQLPLLEAWLHQHPDVDVVISSTWRLRRSLDELRSYFSSEVRERIVGCTPSANGVLRDYFPREFEVLCWMRDCGEPWRPWVALDDQPWLYQPFNKRLVVCDPHQGVTEADLARLSTLIA